MLDIDSQLEKKYQELKAREKDSAALLEAATATNGTAKSDKADAEEEVGATVAANKGTTEIASAAEVSRETPVAA